MFASCASSAAGALTGGTPGNGRPPVWHRRHSPASLYASLMLQDARTNESECIGGTALCHARGSTRRPTVSAQDANWDYVVLRVR
jgi:hypothetical protein